MSVPELEGLNVPRPKFDWTINLGHVATIVTLLLALATAYSTYQVTINDHDSRLRTLEKQGNHMDSRINEMYGLLYTIKQDMAIIKYRIEEKTK